MKVKCNKFINCLELNQFNEIFIIIIRLYRKLGKEILLQFFIIQHNFIFKVYLLQNKQNTQFYAAKFFNKHIHYAKPQGKVIYLTIEYYKLKQAIQKEIEILREIEHPNILSLIEVFETENSLYLITNFLQGESILNFLKAQQPIDFQTSKFLIEQLLSMQMYLQSKGIMHRDLKPENLILANNFSQKLVLIDFGLAEKIDSQPFLFPRCGTPGYVAPEIANNKEQNCNYGCESDIFSIGCIMHLIILGKQLFQGKSHLEVLNANKMCQFDFNGTNYEKLSSSTKDLLSRLLEVNPAKRITAEEALAHDFFYQSSMFITINYPKDPIKSVELNYLKQNFGELPQSNDECEPDYQPNMDEGSMAITQLIPCFQSIQSALPLEQVAKYEKQNEEAQTEKSQTSASINQENFCSQWKEIGNNQKLQKTFQPPQKLSTAPFIQSGLYQQQQQQQQQHLSLPNNYLAFQFLSNQKNQNSNSNSKQNTFNQISPIIEAKEYDQNNEKDNNNNNVQKTNNSNNNDLVKQIPIMNNNQIKTQFSIPVKMQTSPIIYIQNEQEYIKNQLKNGESSVKQMQKK